MHAVSGGPAYSRFVKPTRKLWILSLKMEVLGISQKNGDFSGNILQSCIPVSFSLRKFPVSFSLKKFPVSFSLRKFPVSFSLRFFSFFFCSLDLLILLNSQSNLWRFWLLKIVKIPIATHSQFTSNDWSFHDLIDKFWCSQNLLWRNWSKLFVTRSWT